MEREYTTDKVPDKLSERIQADKTARFRRRAVLTKANTAWELVCCTVEGFLPGESGPEPVQTRRYRQAVLFEDFLTPKECLTFAHDLQEGHAKFGDIDLRRSGNTNWTTEIVPVSNEYMERAGHVVSLRFSQNSSRGMVRTLLSADQPYYPDSDDATRDWLPFRVYHGHSDARNDQVLFLLPQTRAYIADAAFLDGGTLEISIAGTEAATLNLLVKGAYWEEKSLHHVEASVNDGKATLIVPEDAERFEYYLIDHDAVVFDFHREDRFSRQNRATSGSMIRVLEDQVRKACQSGEGL